MNKNLLLIITIILLIPISVFSKDIELNSQKYLIYDKTDDTILINKDNSQKTSIASLTKIASAIVILENNRDLNKTITITKEMLDTVHPEAHKLGLKEGDVLTINDLLYATLLDSSADAVNALAIYTSGSIENFVKLMNDKARKLKLKTTKFENPIGLDDENNYSSLDDVLKLMKYCLKNKKFKKIFEADTYVTTNKIEINDTVKTIGEKLKIDTSRITGNKTGYTGETGFAIAFSFISHEHIFYTILTNADTKNFNHVLDAINIINYIDKEYKNVELTNNNKLYKSIDIEGRKEKYDIYLKNYTTKLLPNDYKKYLKVEDNLPKTININDKIGMNLGSIKYYYKDKLIYQENIKLESNINNNLYNFIKKNIFILIIIVVIIGYSLYIARLFKK